MRAPAVLHLGLHNSLSEADASCGGSCTITLFAPYWFNNRTGEAAAWRLCTEGVQASLAALSGLMLRLSRARYLRPTSLALPCPPAQAWTCSTRTACPPLVTRCCWATRCPGTMARCSLQVGRGWV